MKHNSVVARASAMLALLLFNCALSAGCGSDPDETDNGGTADDGTGDIEVALVFDPNPPTVGANTLRITATGGGAAVENAVVAVDGTMPAHGHGLGRAAVVTTVSAGVYEAYPVQFTMPGEWVITVDVAAAAGSAHLEKTVTVE